MLFHSSIDHFLGSTLFSFKYRSPFFLRMVLTYFHSSIAHLERFVQEGEFSWTVNSCGHFLMVITNGANAGGAVQQTLYSVTSGQGVRGAKPLLGSANTVQCQG